MLNENGDIMNTEDQERNTGNIPKRSRFYQVMIDSKQLEPGETDYNKLENVHIIIIASFDLFGKSKYCYKFGMQCKEVEGLKLMDGGERIFFNTKGTDPENISEELRWMLRYFEETTKDVVEQSGSERIMRMHKHIEEIKSSDEFSFKYQRELEIRQEMSDEARAEGLAEGKIEMIRNFRSVGVPIETIIEVTGLTKEEIEAL